MTQPCNETPSSSVLRNGGPASPAAWQRAVRDILARQDWQLVAGPEFAARVQAEANQRLAGRRYQDPDPDERLRATEQAVKHLYSQTLYRACRAEGQPQQHRAYQELGRYLFRIAYNRFLGRPAAHELAEECTQEALFKVYHKISDCRDPGSFLAWCTQIVINEARQTYRIWQRSAPLSEWGDIETEDATDMGRPSEPRVGENLLPASSSTTSPDAAQAMLDEELARILSAEIQTRLRSKAQQQVLLLGFIGDLDDQQIAARLGTTAANVHTLRCRALKRLREDEEFVAALRTYVEAG